MVLLMDEELENAQWPKIDIGERVEVFSHRGTVKYVGSVFQVPGTWVGIDWDDPARGKHDGTYKGVRYFEARYETSGTLVRIEKITFGQSIISAIKERYSGEDKNMDSQVVEEVQRAINAPFLMMVGFDKVAEMQSYESLTIVGVREHRVNSAGEQGKLKEMCPGIVELDLARNLINSWIVVADITSQLPHLTFLDLSENRLCHNCNLSELQKNFLNLEYLVLSKVEYTWDDILKCAVMWPSLQRLQVSFNKISYLSVPPSPILQNLKMLNIEGNSISEWSEVLKLGLLPRLQVLNVCNIGLTKIELPSSNNLFPELKYILLSGNYINNWESISELEKLPSIDELKFRDNPILNGMSRETARQILIARISKLKMLNGQDIPDEERRGAEYDYLKQNGKMWLESSHSKQARESFLTLHPRYPSLVQKYGEIDEGELEVKSTALKNQLMNVNLVYGETVMAKRLPDVMTVRSLCGLIQRLFNTGCTLPTLILKNKKDPNLEIPLDNGLKPLGYYSIEEGDTILIS